MISQKTCCPGAAGARGTARPPHPYPVHLAAPPRPAEGRMPPRSGALMQYVLRARSTTTSACEKDVSIAYPRRSAYLPCKGVGRYVCFGRPSRGTLWAPRGPRGAGRGSARGTHCAHLRIGSCRQRVGRGGVWLMNYGGRVQVGWRLGGGGRTHECNDDVPTCCPLRNPRICHVKGYWIRVYHGGCNVDTALLHAYASNAAGLLARVGRSGSAPLASARHIKRP